MNVHEHPLLQREIVIRTPENIELRYAVAGAGSRAAAYFIDLLIMFFAGQLLTNLVMYLIVALMSWFSQASELWAGAVAGLFAFAFYNAYFIVFEWLMNGQTPGKRLLHIRVIKEGGYALRFFDTLLRNLLRVVDFIPLFYGVGLASLLLSRNCQRLGDLAAGTLVVHQEPASAASLLDDLPAAPAGLEPLPAAQLNTVAPELLTLAAEYLSRRTEFAPRPRQELGAELVDLVQRSSGLEPQTRQSTEGFLAAVIRQAEQLASTP